MFKKSKVKLETYRQNIEAELAAMLVAISFVVVSAVGCVWAVVFILTGCFG